MIEINNFTQDIKSEKIVKKTTEKVLEAEKKQDFNISIVLVGEKRIKALNKLYRKKNQSTDVLSFPNVSGFPGAEKDLGEIIICPKRVKKNVSKPGSLFKTELMRTAIHGILHLLGHSHKKDIEKAKMEKKQNFHLKKLKKSI